jgi:hypothetical protein
MPSPAGRVHAVQGRAAMCHMEPQQLVSGLGHTRKHSVIWDMIEHARLGVVDHLPRSVQDILRIAGGPRG